MSDEELSTFDINLQKKKKKKKTTFDPEAVAVDEMKTVEAVTGDNTELAAEQKDSLGDVDLDFSNLQKKKKKKKATDSEISDTLQKMNISDNSQPQGTGSTETAETNEADMDFSLDLNVKKKKKKKATTAVDDLEEADDAGENVMSGGQAWEDTDRDYTYDELLKRVFDIMHEKNPDMVAGEKKRFVMRPPQVMRVGTKKTSFSNFAEICKMLHRQPKHLLAFLLAELGTSGSLDGNSQLIIKGRFQQKQIETVLRGYIKEYVTCHTCRSPDTFLQKDTHLYFLQCETCGSRCSVTSIKSGFQAVTSKRAAIRAKTT